MKDASNYKRSAELRLLEIKHQNSLAARLRSISEDRSLVVLRRLIRIEPTAGLKIANRSIKTRRSIETLFREGLQVSNESTVKIWLTTLPRRIGEMRALEIIRNEAGCKPEIAKRVSYWLSSTFSTDNVDVLTAIEQLRHDFKVRQIPKINVSTYNSQVHWSYAA